MDRARLAAITQRYKGKRIAVCGDFFLDRYLWIDPARAEISVETGSTAHQVVAETSAPGAAGTVAANLAALGASVVCVGVIGDDGDGYTLRRGLHALGVDDSLMITTPDRPTATYTKPVVRDAAGLVHEHERLDIRARTPLPAPYSRQLCEHLDTIARSCDAIVFADQMPEDGAGAITTDLHETIAHIAQRSPDMPLFADSRRRIGAFRSVICKPNIHEAAAALGLSETPAPDPALVVRALSEQTGRPVVMTLASAGALVCTRGNVQHIAALPVDCPIDVVGAGDSVMAALALSCAAGATLVEATEIAMYVAGVTIRQLGTTGTATVASLTALATHYQRLA